MPATWNRKIPGIMVQIHQHAEIHAAAGEVFAVVIDLPGYNGWLPQSSAFKGTTQVSTNPIRLGTTYIEPGPTGVRKGEVTEFEEPTKVTFHHPMTLKPQFLGITIDVTVCITVKQEGPVSHVDRVVSLDFPWPLWLIKSIIVKEFRKESGRTLLTLKSYIETRDERVEAVIAK
jgi:uncharacterized cupredoxin-like copper-binding protein